MKRFRSRAVIAVTLMVALSVQFVSAHPTLVTSDPAAGSTVPAAPDEVRLVFDMEIDTERSSMQVVGPDGGVVAEGEPDLEDPDRGSMTADLPPDLPAGEYTVSWTAVEVDADEEHVVEEQFTFTIDPTATPAASPTPTNALVEPEGTFEPLDDAVDVVGEEGEDDDGISRGALVLGSVTVLIAVAVVATIRRRAWWR